MSVSSLALSHSRCFNIADKVFNGKTMKYFFLVSDWDLKGLGSALGLLCNSKYWLCSLSPVAPDWLQRAVSLCSVSTPSAVQSFLCSSHPNPCPCPTPRVRSLVGLVGIGSVPRLKENSWQSVKEKVMSEQTVWILVKVEGKKKRMSKPNTVSVLNRE